jgi:hypothetical protein
MVTGHRKIERNRQEQGQEVKKSEKKSAVVAKSFQFGEIRGKRDIVDTTSHALAPL